MQGWPVHRTGAVAAVPRLQEVIMSRSLILALVSGGLLAFAASAPALAQVRAPTARPAPQPGLLAPEVDPSSQAHSTIMLRLDAVEQAAMRQLVILEYDAATAEAAGEIWPTSSDNFNNNPGRATALCSQALGDRFGRMISYQRAYAEDRYFFSRTVCETR
jgi:hypothetical protein